MNEIDFIGYSAVHPSDFVFDVPRGHDCYLLLFISTSAEFLINNEIQRVSPGSSILYTPGYKIYYRACQETYQNDWIRFHSDESFVKDFPFKNIPFSVGDPQYCHNLLKLLTWESSFASINSELTISHLLQALFLKLSESSVTREISLYTQELIALHKKIHNSPHLPWSVSEMAKDLHLSVGYLQVLYKKMFGYSCIENVIVERLRRAKEQLIYTIKPMKEISEDCGYNNVEHFSRQFHQYNGCSPSRFRSRAFQNLEITSSRHLTLVDKGTIDFKITSS